MAIQLNYADSVTGGGRINDPDTGITQNGVFGGAVLPRPDLVISSGTDDFQANNWYLARRTVAGTTSDNLDLAGGLSNFGGTLTFTKIKRVYVAIIDPDGVKSLRVGPQSVSNAWTGPFGSTSDYASVMYRLDLLEPYDGWTVAAGTADILGIYNPGATPVTYAILLIGIV